MRVRAAVLVVMAIALSACGNDDDITAVGDVAAIELAGRVEQVRSAAEAGEVGTARDRLAEVSAAAQDLRDRGELTADEEARILAAAAEVEQRLALIPTTTTTTATTSSQTTTTPTTTNTTPPRDDEDRDGDDGGRGKGRDKGDD